VTPLDIAKAYTPSLTGEPSALRPDPVKSQAAAKAYEALPHTPHDPLVAAAYDALKREIKAQHAHLIKHGVKIEPWTRPGQPYANSDAMRADVATGHLYFFPTGAEMDESHPLAERDAETGHRYNDLFRAVHDYFGHAVHPHQFGPTGEIRAWHEHGKMFSPLARLALTTETHGQNSWVNYGPHAHLPVTERPYAEQKAAILPTAHHPVKLSRDLVDEPWKVERVESHVHRPILADDLEERNWHHDQRTLDLLRGDVLPPPGHTVHVAVNPFSKKVQAWHDNHALRPTQVGVHGPGGRYLLVHDGHVENPRYTVHARNPHLPVDTPIAREPYAQAMEIARRMAWGQRVAPEKKVPTPLPTRFRMARTQAPAGGGIVNNTYTQGGKFMARPRRRIAEVVAALKRLKLSRAEAQEPHGDPGDPIHEADGPGGRWAVWPHGDGRVYVVKHDDEGDALEHFWHPALGDAGYFPADKVHLACAAATHLAQGKPLKLARPKPISRAQMLESKGIDPATTHLTHDDVVKLDPKLAKEAAFVGNKIDASVPQLAAHFHRLAPNLRKMSSHQIGQHLLDSLSAELPHEPDPDMRDWYGPHSRAAVRGFHTILGYPDRNDDPHQVIAKMLLAITSNNAHPNLHYGTTVRLLKAGGGDPAAIPEHNEPSLKRFHELAPAYKIPVPARFKDEGHATKWAYEHHSKIKKLLAQHKDAGYYGAPAIVAPDGSAHVFGRGEKTKGANALIPLLQGGKIMLPKRWAAQKSVGAGIARLRGLVRALGVDEAAKFLVDSHHPDDVRKLGGLGADAEVAVDYLPITGGTPGSFMFGPKIGSFFQNVHGNEKYMTADRWLGYTAGRLGMPGMFRPGIGQAVWGPSKRQLLYKVLEALVAKHPKKLRSIAQAQAILWGPEQEIANQYTVKKRKPGNFGEASRRAVKKFGKKPVPTLFDGL